MKVSNIAVYGWEHSIRGMRRPMNSQTQSDTIFNYDFFQGVIDEDIVSLDGMDKSRMERDKHLSLDPNFTQLGDKDLNLMQRLIRAGKDHRKFMRQIVIYCDIDATLKWWKQFDTYKVGTVANSESTMHKITSKDLDLNNFNKHFATDTSKEQLQSTIDYINELIDLWDNEEDKEQKKLLFEEITDVLPSNFIQGRTILMNYEVAFATYWGRKNHKLDEWQEYIKQLIYKLPYQEELITEVKKDE